MVHIFEIIFVETKACLANLVNTMVVAVLVMQEHVEAIGYTATVPVIQTI